MVRAGRDDGAVTAEYAAMLLLAAALVLALLLSGISPAIADAARHALCQIFTDGPCPTAPSEPEALNRMGLPCLTQRNTDDMGFSVVVKGLQWDRGSGYTVEQLGTSTFRVTLYGEDAFGFGTIVGDGPGSISGGGWKTGRYGNGSVTLGGRLSTSYDFETREEAEAFAQGQRGGFKQWLHTLGGVPGHAITQGWEWLKRQVTDEDEREPSFTSTQVNLRAYGQLGFNGGWAGAQGNAGEAISGVHTQIHLNGWSVFTASLDGSAAAGLSAAFFSGSEGVGGAVRYRVLFDENDEPLRLVAIVEWGNTETIGAEGAAVGNSSGAGGGGSHSRSTIHIEEHNLDLRDPANRAAFDNAFDYVPGYIAVPRSISRYIAHDPADTAAMGILAGRVAADGVIVRLEYGETAPAVGTGFGLGAGAFGFVGGEEWIERELEAATIVDRRWADQDPRRFETCWRDDGGAGVPSGGGSPGDGPGQ